MRWYFLNTSESSGKFNMDFDKFLCTNSQPETAYFRVYRWSPYCISLGANQDINTVDVKKAEADGIEVVHRPTGGRAILHSEELTYSVVLPSSGLNSARNVYHQINLALAEGLKRYDKKLSGIELETEQPKFPDLYKTRQGDVCFAVPAKSELKYNGKKLVGSAQRKLNDVILQHGSILCGTFHRNITDYLYLTDEERKSISHEMETKTIELNTITGLEINYDKLSLALLAGFEHFFKTEFELADYTEILADKNGVVNL